MKKLLIALLFVSGVAQAEEWWEAINESGGKIVLLGGECNVRPDAKTMKRMYAAHLNGKTWWGCWNYFSGGVHVLYDNGDSYTYDPSLFTRRGTQ